MTHDIQALMNWILACLVVAGICATAFPILYAFSPWYLSKLGRALMIQSIAYALALDLTAIFTLWTPNSIMFIFWTNAFVFTFITCTSAYLTYMMVEYNYQVRQYAKEFYNVIARRASSRHTQDVSASQQLDVRRAEEDGDDHPSGSGDPVLRAGSDLGSPPR